MLSLVQQRGDLTMSVESIPFETPRRRDRALQDKNQIEALLTRVPVGVVGMACPSGPSVVPNLFVYDRERRAIYLHTARTGRTRTLFEEGGPVCFCVAEMGRLLPSDAAVSFSVEYASVVLEGRGAVVDDPAEATEALSLFMTKYAPQFDAGKDYRDIEAKDLARTSVLRIDIERWSAKGKSSDAADAYEYEAVAPPAACPVS